MRRSFSRPSAQPDAAALCLRRRIFHPWPRHCDARRGGGFRCGCVRHRADHEFAVPLAARATSGVLCLRRNCNCAARVDGHVQGTRTKARTRAPQSLSFFSLVKVASRRGMPCCPLPATWIKCHLPKVGQGALTISSVASGAGTNPALDSAHWAPAGCRWTPSSAAMRAAMTDREGNSMSDFDRNYAAARRSVGADRAIAVDAGLRAYMIRVYNYLAMGVALTGVVSWLTFNAAVTETAGRLVLTPLGQMIYSGPASIVLLLGTLGMVFLSSWRINSLAPSTAFTLFMVYAALLGLMLSSIFLVYTGVSITRVFFISAASFGALSLYGYTTQRDLSPIGSFMMMGLIGLIIAMLVNLFLKSTGLDFVISAAGVLIFAGLTAWDTQRIKEMYDPQEDGTIVGRKAVMGALSLYLDFINLFLFMLRFLGDRR